MTSILLAVVLVATAPELEERARKQFAEGALEDALATLDRAVMSTTADPELAAIQLLRGQVLVGLEQFGGAEKAFLEALKHDPDATLDPRRVLPSTVAVLDRLKDSARGTLRVEAPDPSAKIAVDGAEQGAGTFEGRVRIGTRRVRVSAGGEVLDVDARVFPDRITVVKDEVARLSALSQTSASLRGVAEARGLFDPRAGVAAEVGGGVTFGRLIALLDVTVGARVGVTARVGARLAELAGPMGVHGSIDGVVFVTQSAAPGVGATLGMFAALGSWDLFLEATGRIHPAPGEFRAQYLLVGMGVRLAFGGGEP